MSQEKRAFLCVADITGYTGYLNESELEHAKGTLTHLLGLLVDHAGPPMQISKLEGDAVFSYAFEQAFTDGRTFLDLIEGTYVAFRRAIDLMVLNNTCGCNACANVSSLDLKFVIHFGSFLFQRIGGHDELFGPDINLVHRLLKNTVTDRTGLRAYCLYTGPAWERLGLQDVTSLVDHEEDVPDFGRLKTYVQDLGEVYRQSPRPGITLDDSQLLLTQQADVPMSPAVLWDYLSSPAFRNLLIGAEKVEITDRVGGRLGVGSVYQCYHGDRVTPQTILEWEPFTKVVTEDSFPKPMAGSGLVVTILEETPLGTRLTRQWGGFKGPRWTETLFRMGAVFIRKMAARSLDSFVAAITEDYLKRSEVEAVGVGPGQTGRSGERPDLGF
jgi:hypothetical protein